MTKTFCIILKFQKGFNHLTLESANLLSKSLEINNTLEEIVLGQSIALIVKQNSFILFKFPDQNEIGDQEIEVLCAGFSKNTSLLRIDLKRNEILTGGGKFIAQMLKKNSTLLELNLCLFPMIFFLQPCDFC